MKKLRKILDRIMRVVIATILLAITLLTVWQVVTRYFLGHPSTWSEEVAAYLFVWVTVLGAAYVFGLRDHMNIPILSERVNPQVQRILAIISEVITLIFALTVMIYGGVKITDLTMGQMASSIPVAMGYFYSAIPISGVFIAIYNVLNLYDLFTSNTTEEEVK